MTRACELSALWDCIRLLPGGCVWVCVCNRGRLEHAPLGLWSADTTDWCDHKHMLFPSCHQGVIKGKLKNK